MNKCNATLHRASYVLSSISEILQGADEKLTLAVMNERR